jgi:hypothetical protein
MKFTTVTLSLGRLSMTTRWTNISGKNSKKTKTQNWESSSLLL